MSYGLQDLFTKPGADPVEIPREIKLEADLTERMSSRVQDLEEIADHSVLNCPDCGGGLCKIRNDNVTRYRCHTGHVYTEKVLMQVQSEEIEETLWVAIRMLEERRNLLLSVANHERDAGLNGEGVDKNKRAKEVSMHIDRLKTVLQTISLNEPND
jgi:two-component system chemotaxis response regulator CheB